MKKETMCLYGPGFRDLVLLKSTNVKEFHSFIVDETVIQIGNQHYWLGFCIEPIHRSVLGIYISKERNMENIQFILMVEHGMMNHAMY